MKSDVVIENESSLTLDDALCELLRGAVFAALCEEKIELPCEVSLLLTTNDKIHKLNLEYREKDRPTDVLSFPIYDSREELEEDAKMNDLAEFFPIGDVVIAPDVVREAAGEIPEPFEKHLSRMCIHSVLHLLGYDHETGEEDEKEMIGKQEAILENFWKTREAVCQN